MTIQVNVLIWTVLCFCAFMLILWRLLLKPLLAFMDARNSRIAHARSLDKTAEKERQEALAETQRLAEIRQRSASRKQAIQALREESTLERETREKRYLQETKKRREELEAEASELVPELAVSLKDHVDAFTDKLMAFGER
jgi:F0F1-type ATP synthase membrane subunit b/b'